MKSLDKYMNVPYRQRLSLFIMATILMFVIASVLSFLFLHFGKSTQSVRIMTVLQDILMFIVPPILTALIVCRLPARLLMVDHLGKGLNYLLIVIAMAFSVPAMNYIVSLNEAMHLPAGLEQIEQWMRDAEANALESTTLILGGTSVADLIINILIVGILAGFSEEIFFRGGLQRLMITGHVNAHVAIWVTAFIFSAIHLQFYGFIPRLLLGAYFGYLAWWSQSLWLPVAAHALNNTIVVVGTWMSNRALIPTDSLNEIGANPSTASTYVMIAISFLLTALTIYLIYLVNKDKPEEIPPQDSCSLPQK